MYECQQKSEDDNSNVRVAIRIRPQNAKEHSCHICTVVTDKDRQVILGRDKAFTFDYVFDMEAPQEAVYNTCISSLVEGCFEGYNATVFAYGQTGSGKTYTMGTGLDTSIATIAEEIGIVPRAVDHLFRGIEKRRSMASEKQEPAPDFKVTAQFMELYNEEIIDLLDTLKDPQLKGKKSQNRIHEDSSGDIFVVGVTLKPVLTIDDTLQCLKSGVLSRATATTNMNISSSRSHAIFTLHILQHRAVKDEISLLGEKETDSDQTEFETLAAKFHFVDLAGSERLKRTGATGDRAKEGISINCGLLALGNVISALGDNTKKGNHVPYRDSKLTRLLQDSLGGNSRTLMVACISPSDCDFMETLNTLKYANRVRNITNKITANQDKSSKQINLLRAEIASLRQELIEFKMGKRTIDAFGLESLSDLVVENSLLKLENEKLQHRIQALQDTVETVKTRNTQLLTDAALSSVVGSDGQTTKADVSNLITKFVQDIEDLKTKLTESESIFENLSKSSLWASSSRMSQSSASVSSIASEQSDSSEISAPRGSKKEMRRLKKLLNSQIVSKKIEMDKMLPRHDEHTTKQKKSVAVIIEGDGGVQNEEIDIEDNNSESDTSLDSATRVCPLKDLWYYFGDSDVILGDLTKLTCEITIKQRLIKEMERMQKKMDVLKAHYENRVQQLQHRIRETEMERDIVMSDIDITKKVQQEVVKKLQQEFEKKLNFLQEELKMTEQRKHIRTQKNSLSYERHLKTLRFELTELKTCEGRLLKQVKEEVDRNKRNENRNSKELSQLRKEQLRMDNVIKNLERKTAQKDAALKQKQQETEALKQKQKSMFAKSVSSTGKYGSICPIVSSVTCQRRSSKVTRQKWDCIEKTISAVVTKHQTILMLERDRDVWLQQLDKYTKEIETYQQETANEQPEEVVCRMNTAIEDLSRKVEEARENIIECQARIMQMEKSKKDGGASVEVSCLLETMTLEQSKYMIQKLYHRSLDTGLSVAHKELEMRKLLDKLSQTELNNTLQQSLLRHMIDSHVSLETDNLSTCSDSIDVGSASKLSSPAESFINSEFCSFVVVLSLCVFLLHMYSRMRSWFF